MNTTCIRNAAWIVAWDASAGCHAYLRDADVVFTGDTIDFVGRHWAGVADTEVDGRERLVIPGLVDIHSHPSTEPFFRGLREEHGVPQMWMSGLYERGQAYRPQTAADRNAAKTVAYSEMLLTGVTTVADLSGPDEGWIDLAAASGLRVFLAPGYASARWKLEGEWKLGYAWDEAGGRRGFEAALGLIAAARGHASGRLSGIVFPAQIDTCTADLLADSHAAAVSLGVPFTTHCAQSVNEFNEMVNRTGLTPIQWAQRIGVLSPSTILGHAIFTDEHSWVRWHTRRDVAILAETGTSVAHCPSPFARYGHMLEDFGRYGRAGINMGFGTDVAPHNLVEEMRLAAILARIAARDIETTSTAALFHAATVGGATALGRTDIGRVAVGAKADLVLVDLRNPFMRPARDPLRSLVYTAADRAIRDVYVAGSAVVRDGGIVTMDHEAALEALAEAQARMMADTPGHDFRGRTAAEITPLSLPVMQ